MSICTFKTTNVQVLTNKYSRRLILNSFFLIGLYKTLEIIVFRWKYQSKEGGKDQELIQSSTMPDPGHRIGK